MLLAILGQKVLPDLIDPFYEALLRLSNGLVSNVNEFEIETSDKIFVKTNDFVQLLLYIGQVLSGVDRDAPKNFSLLVKDALRLVGFVVIGDESFD